MDHTLIHQLKSNGFTATEIQRLGQVSQKKTLPSKHVLVPQDSMADTFYFLLDGICHATYLTDHGNQFSKEFYWQGDWVIGFEGLINHTVSPYTLETITPVTLITLPIRSLHQWRHDAHPLYVKLLETQLVYKERKERFMLLHSPQARYEIFCHKYPHLLHQLTDYQIAAYLGITHISLSRIKNRIKNKLT